MLFSKDLWQEIALDLSQDVAEKRLPLCLLYSEKQNNLRVIGYDTVPHQMYQPSLPKVHKQSI